MSASSGICNEIERIRRVSDMLCTGHAGLRDRYARRALLLDLAILTLSLWLVAVAFVEPTLGARLTPFRWDHQIWIGTLGVLTFLLTIIQLKTDWKARADAHSRTLDLYSEVKREAGYLIATGDFGDEACRRVLARYDLASAVGMPMPEAAFLSQKRRHKLKVALSKHLDTRPGASLTITRVRFWIRDNFGKRRR